MTRRLWLAGLAASLVPRFNAAAAEALVPLDEDAFRRMVGSHKGRVLLADFWATWCAPCREELPKLMSLYSGYRQRGLDFATISCDEPEQETAAAAFIDKLAAPRPRYIKRPKDDDNFINAIDAKWSGALPALFLFDRRGRQAHSFIGETEIAQVEASIKNLLTA